MTITKFFWARTTVIFKTGRRSRLSAAASVNVPKVLSPKCFHQKIWDRSIRYYPARHITVNETKRLMASSCDPSGVVL
jgi:hypothetical protein